MASSDGAPVRDSALQRAEHGAQRRPRTNEHRGALGHPRVPSERLGALGRTATRSPRSTGLVLPTSPRDREPVGRLVSRRAQKNHASVRLEPEILDRIDALIPRFSTTGRSGTRSDAVRALILSGLEHLNDAEGSELAELDDGMKTTGRVR